MAGGLVQNSNIFNSGSGRTNDLFGSSDFGIGTGKHQQDFEIGLDELLRGFNCLEDTLGNTGGGLDYGLGVGQGNLARDLVNFGEDLSSFGGGLQNNGFESSVNHLGGNPSNNIWNMSAGKIKNSNIYNQKKKE